MKLRTASDADNSLDFKDAIYILKALAIFSVICAHSCAVSEGSNIWNVFSSNVLKSIGTAGIFVFYFLSGYFLYFSRRRFINFWKQKILSVILPWFFCGTVVYLYVYLRSGEISLLSWTKWIMGMDTYLYYIVILLTFYLLFFWLRQNKVFLVILTILSVAENVFLFFIPEELFVLRYPYLDPLRFAYMFSLGLLVANYDILSKIMLWCKQHLSCLGILFIASILVPAWFEINYTYFVPWYMAFAIVSFLCCLGLCQCVKRRLTTVAVNTGRWSYAIYLTHMPIAGIVVFFCKRFENSLVTLLRPVIVMALAYLFILMIKKVSDRIGFLRILPLLIGVR